MIDDLLTFISSTIIKYIKCMSTDAPLEEQPKIGMDAFNIVGNGAAGSGSGNNDTKGISTSMSGHTSSNKNITEYGHSSIVISDSNIGHSTASRNRGSINNVIDNIIANGKGKGDVFGKNGPPPSIVLNVERFIRDVENRPVIWNRNYHCNKSFLEQTWDEITAIHRLPKRTLKSKWKGLRDNFRVEYKRIPRTESGEMLIPPEAHESKWIHFHSLLFLTDHMRHRQAKGEPDQYYYNSNYTAEGEDYEPTLVEPDLSNGLIQSADQDESLSPHDMSMSAAMSMNYSAECGTNDSAMYMRNGTNGIHYSSHGHNDSGPVPVLTIKRKRYSGEMDDIKTETGIDPDDDYHYLLSLHPYMKELNPAQKLRVRTKIQKLIFKELYKEDLEETR